MIDVDGAVPVEAIEPDTPDQPEPTHRAAGVRGVAAHYGDPMREQRTLATKAGLVDRSHRAVLAIPGKERAGWLHNLTTQHLATIGPGEGTELLVLSPHGHVEHHAMLAEDGGTAWLDTEPGRGSELLDFLAKMRFLTQVEPADVTPDWALLTLLGPDSGAILTAALGLPPQAGPELTPVPGPKFPSGTLPPHATSRYQVHPLPQSPGWARRGRLGVDLLVPRREMAALTDRLVAAGAAPCGLWAYEAIRVAARVPRLGFETDHRTIPAEVDWIGPAVHLDKGCYRGQETVARVHNLGRPPRRLVLLHLDGVSTDRPPAPHTEVRTEDGRPVGFTGTAVRHYELGMIGLAVLRRNVPDDARLVVGESAAAIDHP